MHSTQTDREWAEYHREQMRMGKRDQARQATAEAAFNAGYDAAMSLIAHKLSLTIDTSGAHCDTRAQHFKSWRFQEWRKGR